MSFVEILSLVIGVLGLVATVAIFVITTKKDRLAKERGLLDELIKSCNALAGSLSPAPLNDILSEITKSSSQVNSSQLYCFTKDITEVMKKVSDQIASRSRAIDNLLEFKRKQKKDSARLTRFQEEINSVCREFMGCTRDVQFIVRLCDKGGIPEEYKDAGISELLHGILEAERKTEGISNVVSDIISQRFEGNEIPDFGIELNKLTKDYAKEEGESISEEELRWIDKPFFGKGSPEVQAFLGCRLFWVENKYREGADWFERAAKQDSALAQCQLGYCYESGRGREQNESIAADWYEKAALQDDPSGLYYLGLCYYEGKGRNQDDVRAADLFEKAAFQGDENAQYKLGICYAEGKGRKQDYAKAADWFEKAARQDVEEAQYELGRCYAEGRGREKDDRKAVEWYKLSALQNDVRAQRKIAYCYYYGIGCDENNVEAANWYEAAANKGDASAQSRLGDCYYHGEGREQDYTKAADWYEKAAEQGASMAQNNLGKCYYDGLGRKKDATKAAEWFQKAAALGEPVAYYNLAILYFDQEIPGNAFIYFKKAADCGYLRAVRLIGECYETGTCVPENRQKAQAYYEIADAIDDALARGVYPEPYVDPFPEDGDTVFLK